MSYLHRLRSNIRFLSSAVTLLFSLAAHQNNYLYAQTATDTTILKKLSTSYISESMKSADTLDELAARLGISVKDLEQVCVSLGIDLSQYHPAPAPVPSAADMFVSKDHALETILAYGGETPYILLVEKKSHTLFVLRYENGVPKLVASYDCKTGRQEGDKRIMGDEKTPEGIYFFTARLSRNTIETQVGRDQAYQYGDMAFTTDYPNIIDETNRKNGGGIWLHGTDEKFSATSSLDTRGCVVTTNESIRNIAQYITLNRTPMIIVDTLSFITKTEHEQRRNEYLAVLEGWRDAWRGKKLDEYIDYYSPKYSQSGRNLTEFKTYKAGIFDAVSIDHINLENIVIIQHRDGVVMQFVQDYAASNLSSRNTKLLYLMQAKSSWKIVAENMQR
jgi:murein L,D-transpeptidase YafK